MDLPQQHESLFDFSNAYEYAQYLGALLDIRFNEKTGLVAINHGRAGYALNGTIGGTTVLGQTGKLGANEAYLYDGLTSFVRVPNHASINALTQWTYATLVNPSSMGEVQGRFASWGNGNPVGSPDLFFNGIISQLRLVISNTIPTAFNTTTTTGLSASTWAFVFWQYDNLGDRKGHIYVNGIEKAYSAQDTLTGTLNPSAGDLFIGNILANSRTFHGLYDWFLLFPRVLTLAEMTNLTKLTGV